NWNQAAPPASPPTANFTDNPTLGNAPLTVQFTDQSTGSITSRDWDFGDGSSHSSAQNPSHTYNNVGDYLVTLTGTGSGGSNSQSLTIHVTPPAPGTGRITYDNSVSSGFQWGVTRVTTPAFIIGSGATRAAMIMVAMRANGAANITASLGGVSGTVIAGTDSGTSATLRTLIFQVINPPSGSQTATVSWLNSMDV